MKATVAAISLAAIAMLSATTSYAQDVQSASQPSLSYVYSSSAVVTFKQDSGTTTVVRTTPLTKGCTSRGGTSCTLAGLTQGTSYKISITQRANRWILNMTMPLNINLNRYPQDLDSNTANKSRAAFLAQLALSPNSAPTIEYIVDPSMPADKQKIIKADLNVSAGFWGSLRPTSIPVRVYLGTSTNFQWIYDNLKKDLVPEALEGGWLDYKLARAKTDGQSFYGGGAAGYGKDGKAVLFFNTGWQSLGDAGEAGIAAHEYTHVMQRYVLNGMGPMLCWVREGHAVYSGFNIGFRASTAAFRNAWSQIYSGFTGDPSLSDVLKMSTSDWKQWFITNEATTPSQCDPYINYMAGALAFQYLYGTYGWQAVNNFFTYLLPEATKQCGSGLEPNTQLSCSSWKTAYRRAFGVSPVDDYSNISSFIVQELQWTTKQNPLTSDGALKIAPPAAFSKK
jgi:hypothetical protein